MSATSASLSLQRLATITSQRALKSYRSWATSEPKNSGVSSVGSWTTTGTPLAFARFRTPWMEPARKLSKPVVVRRHAPLTAPFAVVDATTNIYAFCLIRLNSSVSSNSDIAHWPVLIRLQSQSSSSAAFWPSSTSLSSRSLSVSTQTKSDAIENEVMNELTGENSCDVSSLRDDRSPRVER